MGALDWIDVGALSNDKELQWWNGSVVVTMGDALTGVFGSNNNHVFGSYINLIADPEEILLGKVADALPAISALVGGIGGNTTFNYCSTTTATYIGPVNTIQRAPTISKVTDYILATKNNPMNGTKPPTDDIDMVMVIAVGVLSTLIVCIPAVFELILRFKYPESAQGEEQEGAGNSPEVLKTCAIMITTRLMAILKLLEQKGSLAEAAEQFVKGAGFVGIMATTITLACIPVLGWATLLYAYDQGTLQWAMDYAKRAISD